MMKYSANHSDDFINPKTAFIIGWMQCAGGIAAEVLCMLFLTNIQNTIDTIIRFMALASIAKVDDWYSGALTGDYVLKKKAKLPFKRSKSEIGQSERSCGFRVKRTFYKIIRIIYCSYIYYFMPFTCIVLPYMIAGSDCPTSYAQDYF